MNRRKRLLNVFLPVALLISTVFSSKATRNAVADSFFLKGNSAYEAKDYTSAIQWYDSALSTGMSAPELEFNLANAYYKDKRIAPSILHYERAYRLSPSDEDIAFNMKIVQLKTADKIDAMPEVFYVRWGRTLTQSLSDSLLCLLLVLCSFLFFAALTFYLFSSNLKTRKSGLGLALLLIPVSIFLWLVADYKTDLEAGTSSAIIMDASSYVKSSPDEKGNDLFILHEGTKVEVLDELNDWKKIRIANGTVGWINAASIEVI
ncbi:MAG: hypothetical protein RL021_2201 [Bacteroidota bacterium]|jgi:tetratricopeptide (TPR) repeat protein